MDPKIVPIEWSKVVAWIRNLSNGLDGIDYILGIARSGAPIATALSYLNSNKYLGYVTRSTRIGPEDDGYDIDGNRAKRIARLVETFVLPSIPVDADSFLIVDDVATYGDTLASVRLALLAARPGVAIRFASYAADTTRLRSANPDILSALDFHVDIDNKSTYLIFPWNVSPKQS